MPLRYRIQLRRDLKRVLFFHDYKSSARCSMVHTLVLELKKLIQNNNFSKKSSCICHDFDSLAKF